VLVICQPNALIADPKPLQFPWSPIMHITVFVRKSEVMRTPEHKRSVKNGANSDSVKTGSEMRDNAK